MTHRPLTFLESTGQLWKARAWPVATWAGLGLVLLIASGRLPKSLERIEGRLYLLGLTIAVGALAWAIYTIACPRCRTRLLLFGARRYPITTCFRWLMALDVCPVCAGTGGREARANRARGQTTAPRREGS